MNKTHEPFSRRPVYKICQQASAILLASAATMGASQAQVLEEVVVSARKVQESMQDVPVTVTAISGDTMDQFAMDDPFQLASFVPNMTIQKGGSGSGGAIRLRGIGSSNISGAFDTAISFNIDGVQTNNARFLFLSMFDTEQIEVLKGPQSLYYGKSSTAGVITINSRNPGDEFEAGLTASYEFEEEGTRLEGFVSGPVTDTLGARLAVKWLEVDEVNRNTSGGSNIGGSSTGLPPYSEPTSTTPKNSWRGENSLDARLTLDWRPSDIFQGNFKILYSEYENDGEIYRTDILCTNPTARPDVLLGGAFITPAEIDCDPFDGEIQINDINGIWRTGAPNTVPYVDNEVLMTSLALDWDINENWSMTSVTGYVDLDNAASDNYTFTNNGGPATPRALVQRENFSQEFRFYSKFGGWFDMNGGLYYQNREVVFDTMQFLASAVLLVGLDPVTGSANDSRKVHNTEIDAYSAYLNFVFRPTDSLEINIGGRYSDESHEGDIFIPYAHAFLSASGQFLPSGSSIEGIEFDDDDFNPEATVMWSVSDNVNLFASYKSGFKSGGIDTSVLPTSGLTEETVEDIVVFDSETVDGFEVGVKSTLLDQNLRFNATAFYYVYDDLQTQEFDALAFNFITLNAGEVTTQGVELEALWAVAPGLTLNGALAYTDSEYTDDFFVTGETNLDPVTGLENLEGTQVQGNSKWAGNVGLDYTFELTGDLELRLGALANYRDSYQTGLFTNSYEQDAFWKFDASVSLGAQDGRWQIALIGRNLDDEITVNAMPSLRPVALPDPQTGFSDQQVQISHGREVLLQAKINF